MKPEFSSTAGCMAVCTLSNCVFNVIICRLTGVVHDAVDEAEGKESFEIARLLVLEVLRHVRHERQLECVAERHAMNTCNRHDNQTNPYPCRRGTRSCFRGVAAAVVALAGTGESTSSALADVTLAASL